jgi:hypothetical protein
MWKCGNVEIISFSASILSGVARKRRVESEKRTVNSGRWEGER